MKESVSGVMGALGRLLLSLLLLSWDGKLFQVGFVLTLNWGAVCCCQRCLCLAIYAATGISLRLCVYFRLEWSCHDMIGRLVQIACRKLILPACVCVRVCVCICVYICVCVNACARASPCTSRLSVCHGVLAACHRVLLSFVATPQWVNMGAANTHSIG